MYQPVMFTHEEVAKGIEQYHPLMQILAKRSEFATFNSKLALNFDEIKFKIRKVLRLIGHIKNHTACRYNKQ